MEQIDGRIGEQTETYCMTRIRSGLGCATEPPWYKGATIIVIGKKDININNITSNINNINININNNNTKLTSTLHLTHGRLSALSDTQIVYIYI